MAIWDFKTYGHVWSPIKRSFSDVEHCNKTHSLQNKLENTFGGILHKSTEAWKCQNREYALLRYGSRNDIEYISVNFIINLR